MLVEIFEQYLQKKVSKPIIEGLFQYIDRDGNIPSSKNNKLHFWVFNKYSFQLFDVFAPVGDLLSDVVIMKKQQQTSCIFVRYMYLHLQMSTSAARRQ